VKKTCAAILAVGCIATALRAQTVTLPASVVTASRFSQPAEQAAYSVAVFGADALRAAPTAALDGALRALPAFGLFRRSDSLSANPTAQGVSLRGLGPSGASRTLVLLDGVPLNDPFGGWVAWTKLPREGLARAELVPGGGATAWGNAALGGVVQLLTTAPSRSNPMGYFRTGRMVATFGDFGTRSAEISAVQPIGRGVVQLLGRDFSTDGWALVAPERRGPVDVPAWSRHRWLSGRWQQPLGEHLRLTATARGYEEFRGNGTPYTRNGSREKFLSGTLAGDAVTDFAWTLVGYAQDQSFASTFSSVNSNRTGETPASDQFAVPATAYGAAWTGGWSHAGGARTSAGADLRTVRGETRENFTFTNGVFTRQRTAGGAQAFAGLFALHEWPLTHGSGRRPARGSTAGGRPMASAVKPTESPARSCATTITPTAPAPSSPRAPASRGGPQRRGACMPARSRRSACPPSTSFIGPSARARPSWRPTPRSARSGIPRRNSARSGASPEAAQRF
jgi:hypothetical protein